MAPKATGSSPLTRGKRSLTMNFGRLSGLIPAHAGKTSTVITLTAWKRAHPRSRGENADGAGQLVEVRGSSPLTRGKRHDHCDGLEGLRLIPAHAGKTG